jgi:hypothetical protein
MVSFVIRIKLAYKRPTRVVAQETASIRFPTDSAAKKLTPPATPIARFDILRETLLRMRRILPVVTRVVCCFAGLIAARLPMQ